MVFSEQASYTIAGTIYYWTAAAPAIATPFSSRKALLPVVGPIAGQGGSITIPMTGASVIFREAVALEPRPGQRRQPMVPRCMIIRHLLVVPLPPRTGNGENGIVLLGIFAQARSRHSIETPRVRLWQASERRTRLHTCRACPRVNTGRPCAFLWCRPKRSSQFVIQPVRKRVASWYDPSRVPKIQADNQRGTQGGLRQSPITAASRAAG